MTPCPLSSGNGRRVLETKWTVIILVRRSAVETNRHLWSHTMSQNGLFHPDLIHSFISSIILRYRLGI